MLNEWQVRHHGDGLLRYQGFRLVAAPPSSRTTTSTASSGPDAIAPRSKWPSCRWNVQVRRVAEQAQQFYAELKAAGVDVLFDDRKERPGVMFADMELIGVPHAIVIGDRVSTTAWWSTSAAAPARSRKWRSKDRCPAQGQAGSLCADTAFRFS